LVYYGGLYADDEYDLKINSPMGGYGFGTRTPRAAGDFNGDGSNDLVQYHYSSKTILIYFGGLGFDDEPEYQINDTSFTNYTTRIDFINDFANGVGDDILINQTRNGYSDYYGYSWDPIQNGKPDYVLRNFFKSSGLSVASGDFNNDGITEIFAGSHYDNNYGTPGGQINLYDTMHVYVSSESIENKIHSLAVFPNPVRSVLNISYNSNGYEPVRLKIVDVMGKTHFAEEFVPMDNGENVFRIITSSWVPGIYIIKVQQGSFLETTKFVVTKH